MERKKLRVLKTYLESLEETQRRQIEQTKKIRKLLQNELQKKEEEETKE